MLKRSARKPVVLVRHDRPQVFIVHGRDHLLRDDLAQFLRNLNTDPIVLDQQASGGRTLVEKFEHYANFTAYAVVLLTADDFGGLHGDLKPPRDRARQNVLFELGFFCGKLGRGRVCLIASPDLEMPSDLAGIVYIPLDNQRQWSWQLVREFLGAGLDLPAHVVLHSCQNFLRTDGLPGSSKAPNHAVQRTAPRSDA